MPQSTPNPVLSEKWLMRAAWWVAHKNQIKNIAAGVILVVSTLALVYDAYQYLDYWFFSREHDQQVANQLSANLVNFAAIKVPQPLGLSSVVVLPQSRSNDRYDVLAKLVNGNEKWIADVTVNLSTSDQPEGIDQRITILNHDEQFFIGAGLASSASASASAKITHIAWRRLKNPDDLNSRKPTLAVTDVRFVSSSDIKISGDFHVGQVTFAVTNQSIYNFWSVDFSIVLMDGETPIAASKTTLTKFLSDEKRQVSLNFYTDIPAASNVLVVPYVNVADDSVFMRIPGKPVQFQ